MLLFQLPYISASWTRWLDCVCQDCVCFTYILKSLWALSTLWWQYNTVCLNHEIYQQIDEVSLKYLLVPFLANNFTKPCSHPLQPTPIHSHWSPSTPTQLHPLDSFTAHSHIIPLFLSHSHSFSAHSYPLPLIFSPLFLNLSSLPPMQSHFQSTSKHFTSSIQNCIFFPFETAVMLLVDGLSVN